MNVKQKMATTVSELVTRIKNYKARSYYKNSCFQGHCPTAEEIKNEKVKSLADRLEEESDKETLTNVLEWQERNLSFWHERHPMSTVFWYSLAGSLIVFVIGFTISFISFIISHARIPAFQIPFWDSLIIAGMLGGSIVTAFTIGWMIHSNRKIPVWEGLKNVFGQSLSLNFFLENKLGICRDYAKLTACLLKNLFPESEIYFAYAPSHVATGIKVDDQLYMLDQRLPILTIDKWKDYRHQKTRKRKKLEKLKEKALENADIKPFLSRSSVPFDKGALANRMTDLLGIGKKPNDESTRVVNIPWYKGSIMYEDDELVNYSLARRLKMKILNELVEMSQVIGIEVNRQDDDLIFVVHFNQ